MGMLERVRRFFAMEDTDSYSLSVSSDSLQAVKAAPAKPRGHLVGLAGMARRPVPLQQIVMLETSANTDVTDVAEALKQRRQPIIVNVSKSNKDVAQRMVDFLRGIAYAIDGETFRIADNIYLIVPGTVDVVNIGLQPETRKEQGPVIVGA